MQISIGRAGFLILLAPTLIYYIVLHPGYNIIGDTEEYFLYFNSIERLEDIWTYSSEFVTPLLMFSSKKLGLSFENFLTFSVLVWLFPIFKISKHWGAFVVSLMMLFFTLDIFSSNTAWLLRQYYAALFFGMLLLSRSRLSRVIFGILAILSHISSLLWLPLVSHKISLQLQKLKTHYIVFSLTVSTLAFNIEVVSSFVDWISAIAMGLDYAVVLRKIAFYSQPEEVSAVSGLMTALLMTNLLLLFTLLRVEEENSSALKYLAFAFYQTAITIILRENIVAANRFGFLGYYFAVPIFIFSAAYGVNCYGRHLCKDYFLANRNYKKAGDRSSTSKV